MRQTVSVACGYQWCTPECDSLESLVCVCAGRQAHGGQGVCHLMCVPVSALDMFLLAGLGKVWF